MSPKKAQHPDNWLIYVLAIVTTVLLLGRILSLNGSASFAMAPEVSDQNVVQSTAVETQTAEPTETKQEPSKEPIIINTATPRPTRTPQPTPTLPAIPMGDVNIAAAEFSSSPDELLVNMEPAIKETVRQILQERMAAQAAGKIVPIIPGLEGQLGTPCEGNAKATMTGYDFGEGHWAVDIKCPIYYPEKGVRMFRVGAPTKCSVTAIKYVEGAYTVYCQAGDLTFVFLHMDEEGTVVQVGNTLEKGAFIGTISERRQDANKKWIGTTGRTNGPHIHFQIRNKKGEPIDPHSMITIAALGK